MSTRTTGAQAGLQVDVEQRPAPDPAAVEAFAGELLDVLNHGMLALMLSVGHKVGLFEAMSTLPPADSTTIAVASRLDERYVREWLGAMTTGGVVEHAPQARTFRLPPEHAALLTRAAGPDNMASLAQYVSLLGRVEDQVADCFRHGGGVPYSAFPDFQRVQAEDSGAVFDATLLDVTVPLVPGLHEQLTAGIDAADVGCGSGHAVNVLARAYPASRFVGYDFSEEGVAAARAEATDQGLSNARFEVRDAATLSGPPQFDLVTTFDSVHDQAHPARVLRGIHDLLRPGGTFLCVDIRAASDVAGNVDHPLGPFLYTVSCMHCMTVSLALGGDGLGAAWGERVALEMLHEAGFPDVDVRTVEGDVINSYYIARRV